jgi:hypothetical protein
MGLTLVMDEMVIMKVMKYKKNADSGGAMKRTSEER